jgi:Na+-driven multidrug efflux pump
LVGFQVVSANLFVVTGRPKVSIVLSMLRQAIVLIPCILIFGRVWGLWGVVAAGPTADGFAFLITGTMIFFELRKLSKEGTQKA